MIPLFRLLHAPQDDLLPRGDAPVQPQALDEYGIPENPYVQTRRPAPQRRSRVSRSAAADFEASQTPDAQPSAFAPPVTPDIPDWLRTAQHNNLPLPNRPAPSVQAAPRRRAQGDAPVSQAHAPVPPAPQTGWQVETDPEAVRRELPAWVRKVPWLGVAAFAAVLAAVLVWIAGLNAEKQTAQVLSDRAAQEAAIAQDHPLKYEDIIAEKSEKYNLSPAFVAAVIMNESSFRPDAVAESTGARGLMQLMYDTAEWIHGKIGDGTEFRHNDMHDPQTNVEYGCWYLNYLAKQFGGDPVLVASAFHAGQGEARSWLQNAQYSPDGRTVAIDNIPFSDTRRYVSRVMDDFAVYSRVYYGK